MEKAPTIPNNTFCKEFLASPVKLEQIEGVYWHSASQ